jgi:hypothetical protein
VAASGAVEKVKISTAIEVVEAESTTLLASWKLPRAVASVTSLDVTPQDERAALYSGTACVSTRSTRSSR